MVYTGMRGVRDDTTEEPDGEDPDEDDGVEDDGDQGGDGEEDDGGADGEEAGEEADPEGEDDPEGDAEAPADQRTPVAYTPPNTDPSRYMVGAVQQPNKGLSVVTTAWAAVNSTKALQPPPFDDLSDSASPRGVTESMLDNVEYQDPYSTAQVIERRANLKMKGSGSVLGTKRDVHSPERYSKMNSRWVCPAPLSTGRRLLRRLTSEAPSAPWHGMQCAAAPRLRPQQGLQVPALQAGRAGPPGPPPGQEVSPPGLPHPPPRHLNPRTAGD
jgi:hypothetical protein